MLFELRRIRMSPFLVRNQFVGLSPIIISENFIGRAGADQDRFRSAFDLSYTVVAGSC
jgi:hypothetical protein